MTFYIVKERKREREIKIRMEHENRLKAIKSSRMSNLLLLFKL